MGPKAKLINSIALQAKLSLLRWADKFAHGFLPQFLPVSANDLRLFSTLLSDRSRKRTANRQNPQAIIFLKNLFVLQLVGHCKCCMNNVHNCKMYITDRQQALSYPSNFKPYVYIVSPTSFGRFVPSILIKKNVRKSNEMDKDHVSQLVLILNSLLASFYLYEQRGACSRINL